MKILHFADAHIDSVTGGKIDPSGLPLRVLDFLKSIDTIVDTAIKEKVDLVLFAGDTYKDRMPTPTYQREWLKRIFRLSEAKIPTLMITGNHDVSPASGRANTLFEFDTLSVPYVRVSTKPEFLRPADLWNLPIQILTVPWINSSLFLMTSGDKIDKGRVGEEIEDRVSNILEHWLDELDPQLPSILLAHCSVLGAVFSTERKVMLGKDMVLPGWLVKDSRLDYTALGHIHKFQDLNEGHFPPVIYPGSIERIDFGELNDQKGFIVAEVQKGKTSYEHRALEVRPFIEADFDFTQKGKVFLNGAEIVPCGIGRETDSIIEGVKCQWNVKDSILKIIINFPKEMDENFDDKRLISAFGSAFEFKIVKKAKLEERLRITGMTVGEITAFTPIKFLEIYFSMIGKPDIFQKDPELKALALDIIQTVDQKNNQPISGGE
jgi:exonuclease SbcD